MKKCQQLNSRKKSRKDLRQKRTNKSTPVLAEGHYVRDFAPYQIVILLFPEAVDQEKDDQIRIAVNQILRPFGRPFDPEAWQNEKDGAVIVLPYLFGELAIIQLAKVPNLGFMIMDGESIRTVNFRGAIAG